MDALTSVINEFFELTGPFPLQYLFDNILGNLQMELLLPHRKMTQVRELFRTSVPAPQELEIIYPISRGAFPPQTATYRTNGQVTLLQILETIAATYAQKLAPENIAAYIAADPTVDFVPGETDATLYDALIGTDYPRTTLIGLVETPYGYLVSIQE